MPSCRGSSASLAAYNGFSTQVRAAAVAGNVKEAVKIMTVGNLVPSNALPVEFVALRTYESASTRRPRGASPAPSGR